KLRDIFRPEFLNRIDDILIFKPLGKDVLARIVDIQAARLVKLVRGRDVELTLTPNALELIGEHGYDPQYGAPPLKRAIQKYLQDPLAQAFLAGDVRPGDRISADVENDKIVFHKVGHTAEAKTA